MREIAKIFWNFLEKSPHDQQRYASAAKIKQAYQLGMVEPKKISPQGWQELFNHFPLENEKRLLNPEDIEKKILPFLYQGKIQPPFDVFKLKDGGRSLAWFADLYEKVLKFATVLKIDEWKKLAQEQIYPNFVKDQKVWLDHDLKLLIEKIIREHSSPLRRLEEWIHRPQKTTEEIPETPPPKIHRPQPVKDEFQDQPTDGTKIKSIEKTYFDEQTHPVGSDEESLEFLEELVGKDEN